MPVFCQRLLFISLLATLTACSSSRQYYLGGEAQEHTIYCDSYMMYDMCSEDLNHDGTVDILFFNDTKEVMMYWPPTQALIPADKPLHRCVQIMDEGMKRANSETLYVNEETDLLTVSRIKTGIFLAFAHYWGDVNDCNDELASNDTEFGSDFPDEFDE